jgi:cell division protein FtsX
MSELTKDVTICAIVSDMSQRSNYPFDLIHTGEPVGSHTIIELFPGTDVNAFEKKLYEYHKMIIKPITKLRYIDPDIEREVKFQHIVIFSVSGLLVILCSLFNYLTLFASRLRLRQKELALRVVCGASGGSLLVMLSIEFILTLLFAVVLGCMLTQLLHQPFLALSEIQMPLPSIYRELLLYIAGVIFISLLIFGLILLIHRVRSLNMSIHRTNKNLSRKISVVVQLVISIGFAFSAMVIMKQMYYLHHTDELGFSFHGRGSMKITEKSSSDIDGAYDVIANRLKQIPEITEAVDVGGALDIFSNSSWIYRAESWDDQPADAESVTMTENMVSSEYLSFYNFRLLTGEFPTAAYRDSLVLLNESAVKILGWHDPVGKKIGGFTVKGVINNVYKLAPTIEAKPILYRNRNNRPEIRYNGWLGVFYFDRTVLFTYHEGMWQSCKEKIEQLMNREFATQNYKYTISNSEEEFNKLLKSENALMKLLSFVSAICVLICVFGFVSLVSLTCEERRKEIAIRKINGATAGDILAMFAKEYFLLLVIGAVISFTAGYFIMQRWLEHYVKQTSIPVWIYLLILCALALVIVLCVGWQVYKSSIENPAEVVKSE